MVKKPPITDPELTHKVKSKNCDESLKELISRHSPLCYDIYKKYSSALSASGACLTDIYGEKDYLVYKSAITYDPTKKTKFSTWLGNQVRYYCLNLINNNKHIFVGDESLDFYADREVGKEKEELKEDLEYVFNLLRQLKDRRIQTVFKLRYFHGDKKKMPWVKVAKTLKISTQTAINLHNKGKSILNRKMKSKGLFADNL